jgi:hypothetical protein
MASAMQGKMAAEDYKWVENVVFALQIEQSAAEVKRELHFVSVYRGFAAMYHFRFKSQAHAQKALASIKAVIDVEQLEKANVTQDARVEELPFMFRLNQKQYDALSHYKKVVNVRCVHIELEARAMPGVAPGGPAAGGMYPALSNKKLTQ